MLTNGPFARVLTALRIGGLESCQSPWPCRSRGRLHGCWPSRYSYVPRPALWPSRRNRSCARRERRRDGAITAVKVCVLSVRVTCVRSVLPILVTVILKKTVVPVATVTWSTHGPVAEVDTLFTTASAGAGPGWPSPSRCPRPCPSRRYRRSPCSGSRRPLRLSSSRSRNERWGERALDRAVRLVLLSVRVTWWSVTLPVLVTVIR